MSNHLCNMNIGHLEVNTLAFRFLKRAKQKNMTYFRWILFGFVGFEALPDEDRPKEFLKKSPAR